MPLIGFEIQDRDLYYSTPSNRRTLPALNVTHTCCFQAFQSRSVLCKTTALRHQRNYLIGSSFKYLLCDLQSLLELAFVSFACLAHTLLLHLENFSILRACFCPQPRSVPPSQGKRGEPQSSPSFPPGAGRAAPAFLPLPKTAPPWFPRLLASVSTQPHPRRDNAHSSRAPRAPAQPPAPPESPPGARGPALTCPPAAPPPAPPPRRGAPAPSPRQRGRPAPAARRLEPLTAGSGEGR